MGREIDVHEIIGNSRFNKFFLGVFILSSLTVIFDGYDQSILGAVIPHLIPEMHLSTTQTGLLASIGLAGLVVGSLVGGVVADYIGRKKMILISMILYVACTGTIFWVHDYNLFAVLRFIAGIGMGGIMPNAVAYITEYSPLSARIRLSAGSTVGINVGAMIASGVMILILAHLNWRYMFLFAFLEIILIICVAAFLPEAMVKLVNDKKENKIIKILAKASKEYVHIIGDVFIVRKTTESNVHIAELFKKQYVRNTLLFFIAMFINLYINYGLQTWIPQIMITEGYQYAAGLVLMLLLNIGAVAGVLVFGELIGHKIGFKRAIMIALAVEVIALFSLVLIGGGHMAAAGIALFAGGMGIFGAQGMMNSYLTECYPLHAKTTAIGVAFGVGRIGAVIGPLIGGAILAANVHVSVNFLAFSLPGIVTLIAIGFTKDYTKGKYAKEYSVENEAAAQAKRHGAE